MRKNDKIKVSYNKQGIKEMGTITRRENLEQCRQEQGQILQEEEKERQHHNKIGRFD